MTWLAELVHFRVLAFAAGLALVLVAVAASAGSNASAPAVPVAAVSDAFPAWMQASAQSTNAVEWADLAELWRRQPDAEVSPMENFAMPVEHYDNGAIKAVLHAGKAAIGKAVVGKSGLIWGWKVVIDLRDPTGAPDGRIEADSCLYDRNTRRGYCPAAVLLVRTNATVSGTGMYWNGDVQQMRIFSNAMVQLRQTPKLPGSSTSTNTGKTPRDRNVLEGAAPK